MRMVMTRPLFWLSGLFFAGNDLPPSVRDIFFLNPLLHAVELTRDGWFVSYQTHYANVTYPLTWVVAMGVNEGWVSGG